MWGDLWIRTNTQAFFAKRALETQKISKSALFLFSKLKTKYELQKRQFRAVFKPIETGALFHFHIK